MKITRKHLRQIIKEELNLILESPQDAYLGSLKAEVQGQMAMGFKQIVRDDNFEISDDAMDVFDEDNDGSWKVIRKDEESASLDWDQEDIRAGLIAGGVPEGSVDKVLDDLSFISATSVQKGGFDAAFGKGAFDAIAIGDMFVDAAGIMKKISQRIDTPTSKKEYTGPKGKGQTRYIVTSQLASWHGEGNPDYDTSVFYLVDTVDGTKFEVRASELPYILPTTEGEIEIFDMLPSPSSKESHLVADLNGKEFRLARRDI